MIILTLGPITFEDFEVPESINFGGEHRLVVKKLVGGDRVIDAMGRDDDDVIWKGRFRGQDAESRARFTDYGRIQGQPLVLSYSSFRYLVIIRSFKADFSQPFEIPYSIECTVMQDLAEPVLTAPQGVNSAIQSDLNGAFGLGDEIDVPTISAALTLVGSTASNIASFQGASPVQLAQMNGALFAAKSALTGQINLQNGIVSSAQGVAGASAGLAPQSIVNNLTRQSQSLTQLGQLYQLQSFLGRTSVNVANAGS